MLRLSQRLGCGGGASDGAGGSFMGWAARGRIQLRLQEQYQNRFAFFPMRAARR